ncbi:hypothetical protein D3C85_439950 [compost metagenome]
MSICDSSMTKQHTATMSSGSQVVASRTVSWSLLRVRVSTVPRLASSPASSSHSLSDRRAKRTTSTPSPLLPSSAGAAACTTGAGAGAGAGTGAAALFSIASCCSTPQMWATLSASGSLPAW